jgi:DNA-directed RNA polymerase specialized sigma24 family protein
MARAELLSAEDRELMEAVMVRGQTMRSVARMKGTSERSVGNRVRRLSERLASRAFLDAARALAYLPREDAMLASLRFCAGLSERKLAEILGASSHVVRRRLDRIGAQIAMIHRIQQAEKKFGKSLLPVEGPNAAYGPWPAVGRRAK